MDLEHEAARRSLVTRHLWRQDTAEGKGCWAWLVGRGLKGGEEQDSTVVNRQKRHM